MTGKRLAYAVVVLAALGVGADFLVHRHGHFDFEEIPGFFAAVGLFGGLLMVALGVAARELLLRGEEGAP